MVRSIGIDIVEVDRIRKDVDQFGKRFVSRILGVNELVIYNERHDKLQFLAGRFAAKEAVIKALGQYLENRPAYNAIEVFNNPSGMPELSLPPDIREELKRATCLISISHEKNYAAAVAIIEEIK